jgi:hypothetical protein
VLTAFLVAGHLCEIEAFAAIVGHGHEATHQSPDHHADDEDLLCEAVVAVPSSGGAWLDLGPALVTDRTNRLPGLVRAHVVAAARDVADARSSPPPLFLLHASFLI